MPKAIKNFISSLRTFFKQQRLKLGLGLAGLLVLEAALLVMETASIESDIAGRTTETLQRKGFKRIEIEVAGRDVTLTGAVSSAIAQETVVGLSAHTYGVRSVTANLEIKPLRLPHLRISRTLENILRLEGEVPTQKLANQIADFAANSINHSGIINQLYADPETTDPPWINAAQGIVAEADQLFGMEIVIGADQLSLGGLIAGQSDYNVIVQRVQQFANDHELQFINKIGISPDAYSIGLGK